VLPYPPPSEGRLGRGLADGDVAEGWVDAGAGLGPTAGAGCSAEGRGELLPGEPVSTAVEDPGEAGVPELLPLPLDPPPPGEEVPDVPGVLVVVVEPPGLVLGTGLGQGLSALQPPLFGGGVGVGPGGLLAQVPV
jgi:hypothetical protein